MTRITKHNGEQKWESDDSIECWVNLPIARDTIWIYKILETPCKFIGAIECRWCFCSFNHIQKWRNWTATSSPSVCKSLSHTCQILDWNPTLCNKTLFGDIHVEHVQCVVDSLHFAHHHRPVLKLLRNTNQYTVTMVLCLVENHFQILKSCSHTLHHFLSFSNITGAGVHWCMVPCAHFLDTRFQLFSLEKCHKYRLEDFITRSRIFQSLVYFGLPEEHVTPGDPPQHPLKSWHLLSGHNTCHKPEATTDTSSLHSVFID